MLGAPSEAMAAVSSARRARGLDVPYGVRWERLKERLKKKRRKPYAHGPPDQPPEQPPPEQRGDGPRIWVPPPDLDQR